MTIDLTEEEITFLKNCVLYCDDEELFGYFDNSFAKSIFTKFKSTYPNEPFIPSSDTMSYVV